MLPRLNDEHSRSIETPARFFAELGNLHDAKIDAMDWNPAEQKVVLALDDLYSNFVGLPEYIGKQPVCLILSGVSRLEIEVTLDAFPLRIVDFEIDDTISDAKMKVIASFGPSGFIRATCDSIGGRPS